MAKCSLLSRFGATILLIFQLTACSTETNYAPVTDISMIEPVPASGVHKVAPGETVYEIAWRYGLDYRALAARNHLKPPYIVLPAQVIYLRGGKPFSGVIDEAGPSAPVSVSKPYTGPVKANTTMRQDKVGEPTSRVTAWLWPVRGPIIKPFSSSNKGINIGGVKGAPVKASAAGKVVYCGDGLRRYGKLIIIKHNSLYLSAYAHNSVVFVKEGSWVKQGQIISEMGDSGTDKVMLHFEIRKAGKPVNPVMFLK